jgi:hypothetical protein
MFHLAAFYESVDSGGALTKIAAVADQAIRTDGDDLVVPAGIPNLLAEAALSAQTGPSYAQASSPSLRQLANQDIDPIVAGVVFGGNPAVQGHLMNPRMLKANESVNFLIAATGGSAAANYGLLWLGDGAITKVTGNMFSIRATGTAALSAGVWVNTSITFEETLPAGTYNVVGLRAVGAHLVAARLSLVGGAFRPGVPAVNAVGDREYPFGRYGSMGSFGVFDVNQPPTIDCLGVTDTTQVFMLDLVKTS